MVVRAWISPVLVFAMGLVLVLALGRTVFGWPQIFWLGASFWVLVSSRQRAVPGLPQRYRFPLALALTVAALASAGWGNWLSMATGSLFVLLAFKTMELRRMRDMYQVAILLLLGFGIAAWIRVDPALAFYLLLEVFLALLALLWQGYRDALEGRPHPVAADRHAFVRLAVFAGSLVLALVPAMGILFVLLPRTPEPLWHWGGPVRGAQAGFSPRLDASHLERLVQDPAIAFRARIVGPVRVAARMYWPGAILWYDRGGTGWRTGQVQDMPVCPSRRGTGGLLWKQQILASPGNTRHLFGLGTPVALESRKPVQRLPDGTWELDTLPAGPFRYTVWSASGVSGCLGPAWQRAALQLPPHISPSLRILAGSLKKAGPAATVRNIMAWFHGASFHYSLKTPPGYPGGQTLTDFLLKTHSGFCEFYAAGLATLLRLDGVPARVVVGYRGGEYDPLGNFWIVRQSMAHAWVQAWLPGRGWTRLDATPAGTGAAAGTGNGNARTADLLPAGERVWDWVQWNWLNWVINFSPSRQLQVWKISWLWGSSALAHLHFPLQAVPQLPGQHRESPVLLWASAFAAGIPLLAILLVAFRKRIAGRGKDGNPEEIWRRRALQALRQAGLRDLRPGAELAWLDGLSLSPEERGALWLGIQRQRYAPHPGAAGHQELQEHLLESGLLGGRTRWPWSRWKR